LQVEDLSLTHTGIQREPDHLSEPGRGRGYERVLIHF
jgi:hypothetical protein